MPLPRIHLTAPAGSCRRFLEQLQIPSVPALIERVHEWVGPGYDVSADEALILAEEDENAGGRSDDMRRAEDLTAALADSRVAAIVSLRGGAWFARIMPHINFSVMDRRTRPVAVFGFSELTPLVNVVAAHPMGRGVYDMGPVFLSYGLKKFALRTWPAGDDLEARAAAWAQERLPVELQAYFVDVRSIVEGRGTARGLTVSLLEGNVPDRQNASFAGGNLTVLSTLVGTEYERAIFGASSDVPRFLFLEDYNDKLERFDRFLAHFTLARWWERFAGILLGDFHHGDADLTPQVQELLRFHVPSELRLPILGASKLGHVWPMSPLPLLTPVSFERRAEVSNGGTFDLHWPAGALRCR